MSEELASSWVGQPRVKGSTEFTRMFLLTFSLIGLQFCWSTEMSYATPYLLTLGLSKSWLSFVWVAGPLSGLVMQPLVGTISDKSRSKYGRRRPFMMGGTAAVACCLILLGWTGEVAGWFVADPDLRRRLTIGLAVVNIYVLDFVINISQSASRALIVDTLPVEKQQLGSAWASRMSGAGQILMYAIGALDLNAILGDTIGDSQFKCVCFIAAFAMVVTQSMTCWTVEERVLVSDGKPTGSGGYGLISIVSRIYNTALTVPPRVQAIFWVQFWSWIGWFPFLFYGTTWVGEIYLRDRTSTPTDDVLTDIGRVGSTAMISFSIVSFTSSIVLPWLVRNPEEAEPPQFRTPFLPHTLQALRLRWRRFLPTLLTTWWAGNVCFASAMIFAPLVRSVPLATVLMAACGLPWAAGTWAVGAFIGIEVNKIGSTLPTNARYTAVHRNSDDSSVYEMDLTGTGTALHVRHGSTASSVTSSTGELSGIYLGILNIYTTLPQFVGTGISWVVFSLLEPGKSLEGAPGEQGPAGAGGIGVCLFIGALSAAAAAYATRSLR